MEEWKDIVGYEGFYQISNRGKVRSIDRIVSGRNYKGTELKPLESYGYYAVQLRKKVTKGCFFIHRLVASHFLDVKEGFDFVNHKDENKQNNLYSNLEWCTRSENSIHSNKGAGFLTRKFSIEEILKIRSKYKSGESVYKISKDLKENTGTISNIVKNKTYKNVQ